MQPPADSSACADLLAPSMMETAARGSHTLLRASLQQPASRSYPLFGVQTAPSWRVGQSGHPHTFPAPSSSPTG